MYLLIVFVARIGDSADAGAMTSGSGNVFANWLDNRYKCYGNIRFTNSNKSKQESRRFKDIDLDFSRNCY